jgi:hypothetical protein
MQQQRGWHAHLALLLLLRWLCWKPNHQLLLPSVLVLLSGASGTVLQALLLLQIPVVAHACERLQQAHPRQHLRPAEPCWPVPAWWGAGTPAACLQAAAGAPQ